MLLTKSCQYAIQAVLFLATQPKNSPVLQRDIAESLDIPNHFLGKILQLLVRNNLVTSQKGISGGFSLKLQPEEISLFHIAEIVDGEKFLDGCLIGFPNCSDENPCPLHADWKNTKSEIVNTLRTKRVKELSSDLITKLNYLSKNQPNDKSD